MELQEASGKANELWEGGLIINALVKKYFPLSSFHENQSIAITHKAQQEEKSSV